MDDYRNGRLTIKKSQPLSRKTVSPLDGKKVLVTGGAKGIGRAIVEAFRKENCHVAIFDSDRRMATDTAQKLGARFYPCDLSDITGLRRNMDLLLNDWGNLDIVVNNAADTRFHNLEDTDAETFSAVLAVNLTAPFEISRLLALHRSKSDDESCYGGRIINIASTRAFQSEPGTEAYSASKGGIIALTHALMASLSKYGITVNAIAPGWIETGDYSSLRESDHSCHPSGRVGRPADIARACVFLSMPDADFINGSVLTVDGGMTRKMIYPD